MLCVGNATRLAEYVQRMAKTYQAGIVLGGRSDTDDADGTLTPSPNITPPTRAQLDAALHAFVGTIEQVPPAYSAAKVTGRRAYDLARKGHEVSLTPRRVTIYGINVGRYAFPQLDLEVRCGKGTYIRALARDLGDQLGCGGYIQTLRRTRVGCFEVSGALSLDADSATAQRSLLPLALAVSDLRRRVLTVAEAAHVRQGQPLPHGPGDAADELALVDPTGALVAVGTVDQAASVIRAGKVFPKDA